MSSYNHITLIGNLTKDPESKKIGKKTQTKFTIGCERYVPSKPKEIDYFDIVAWGKLADVCKDYLQAGKKVLVDGRIQIHQVEGKWLTEIVAENLKFLTINNK